MEYRLLGTDSFLKEIGGIVVQAADQGRYELNAKEIEYITRITKRMVKERRMQLGEIAHLLPEEIPQETVDRILRRDKGAY